MFRPLSFGLIIGVAVLACAFSSRIVVVELVEVGNSDQIVISTRFKNSEVMLSNKTRELSRKEGNYTDMSQIPAIEVKYTGTTPRKWRHVKGDTSIYLFKTIVEESALPSLLATRNSSPIERMLLLDRKY
jgi:hypothetical protein